MVGASQRDPFDVGRPMLAAPYVTLLIGELAVLGTLVALSPHHPPRSYEAGWAGAASMIAMQLYSLRRRLRVLRNAGSLRTWLDAHIFLGMQGFVLVAYHSVGITANASLAAVNFALVTIVVITGIAGRYLYGYVAYARLAAAVDRDSRWRAALELADRWLARWSLVHRPLAVVLLGITTLHVLAHYAYAT